MSLKTRAWTFCQGWHIKVESIHWVGLYTLGKPSDHLTDGVTITVVVFPHKQCETEASAGIQGTLSLIQYTRLCCDRWII